MLNFQPPTYKAIISPAPTALSSTAFSPLESHSMHLLDILWKLAILLVVGTSGSPIGPELENAAIEIPRGTADTNCAGGLDAVQGGSES